jgi:hypothetical protein
VLEIGHRAELALELVEIETRREIQGLERDLAAELPVMDQVNTAHAAGAEESDRLEA